jgi:hypothetical protein
VRITFELGGETDCVADPGIVLADWLMGSMPLQPQWNTSVSKIRRCARTAMLKSIELRISWPASLEWSKLNSEVRDTSQRCKYELQENEWGNRELVHKTDWIFSGDG